MLVMTSSFRGYDKKQVMAYLDELHRRHEEEIRTFTDKIETVKHERELFNKELGMLRKENDQNAAARALLEIALKRVGKTVEVINASAGEEIQGIRASSLQRVIAHKNRMAEIDNDIKKTKSEIDAVMHKVLESVKATKENGQPDEGAQRKVVGTILSSAGKSESIVYALGSDMINANHELIGKTVVTSNGTSLGHVGKLILDQVTREIKGFLLKEGHSTEDSFVRADCIMAIKKDSLVVAANYQKEQVPADRDTTTKTGEDIREQIHSRAEGQMTADGITVQKGATEAAPVSSLAGEMNSFFESDQYHGNAYAGEAQRGYWDSLDASWEAGVIAGEEVVAGIDRDEELRNNVVRDSSPLPPATVEPVTPVNTPKSSGKNSGESNEQLTIGDHQARPEAGARVPHPVVEKVISSVWHKYIVGKLAGEDLIDSSGQMLLCKGERITPEVVDRAEQEGKLAELIVHMSGPELEE